MAPRARQGLVIVSSGKASESNSWKPINPDRGCSFLNAAFDPAGIAAVEGCDRGAPAGQGRGARLGDAYLLQLIGPSHQIAQRIKQQRGFNGGGVVDDPRSGEVLISEYQAANQGVPVYNWVWSYNGRALRLIHRYAENDTPEVDAEPW